MIQLKEGYYNATAVALSYYDGGGEKTDCLGITVIVEDGKDRDTGEPIGEVTRTVRLYLSEKALPYTKEKLERLQPATTPSGTYDWDNPSFANPDCRIAVRYEEYNGEYQEKVDLVGQPGGGPIKPEQADKLNALFRPSKPAEQGGQRKPADDLPF